MRKIQDMAYQEKIKICVSGAAELTPCCPDIIKIAEKVGEEIARKGCILLTGATTGVPYYAARGYKKAGGKFSVGFSPAGSKREHLNTYHLPIDQFDLIVYTGFDYVGRNLILTKAADGAVIICGRTGTLNEFTVAFETRTPVGVLQGTGGTADFIDDILKQGHRPPKKVVFDTEPKRLISRLLEMIKKENSDIIKVSKK